MPDPIYRRPPCPLHFGLGFNLECVDCMAMPTIMPDGSLRDAAKAVTTDRLRLWAMLQLRKELDPDAPDVIVCPDCHDVAHDGPCVSDEEAEDEY